MAQVFKTKKDSATGAEIVGAGIMGPQGKGGVPVDRAVAAGLVEFHEKDDWGAVKLDNDGQPIPLSGKALNEAAKDFAEKHDFEVVNLSAQAIAELPQEIGALPDTSAVMMSGGGEKSEEDEYPASESVTDAKSKEG